MRLALIGEGAIAGIHMESLSALPDVAVTHLVAGEAAAGAAFVDRWSLPHVTDLTDTLAAGVDGVIVASPSALHPAHAISALGAGAHVLAEIPVGTDRKGCEALARAAAMSDRVAMAADTRRFSPAHRHMRDRIARGELHLQHLVTETYFLRRENLNMHGAPRSWTDSLIWHHATHSVDLFLWLTGDPEPEMACLAGPPHAGMGCAVDASILLRARDGAMMKLAMSFNNDGPFGGFYRHICDGGTFHAFRDWLTGADGAAIPLKGSAFADQDRAFVDAIRDDADDASSDLLRRAFGLGVMDGVFRPPHARSTGKPPSGDADRSGATDHCHNGAAL